MALNLILEYGATEQGVEIKSNKNLANKVSSYNRVWPPFAAITAWQRALIEFTSRWKNA